MLQNCAQLNNSAFVAVQQLHLCKYQTLFFQALLELAYYGPQAYKRL
jgi:hypothetical protein